MKVGRQTHFTTIVLLIMFGMLYGTYQGLTETLADHVMNSKVPSLPLSIAYFAPLVGFAIGILRQIQSILKGKVK